MADDSKLRSLRPNSSFGSSGLAERSERASGSGADPLAELARLIGQDSVFDQMRRDIAAGTRSAPALRAGAPEPAVAAPDWTSRSGARDLRGSYDGFADAPAAEEPNDRERSYVTAEAPRPAIRYVDEDLAAPAPPAHGYGAHYSEAQAQAYHPGDARDAYDERYYEEDIENRHGAQASADPYDGYGEDAYPEPGNKRSRLGVAALAAAVGLAAIGTAGVFGYRALRSGGDYGQVPIIKADSSPAKVVPPAQSAGEKDSGKALYDRVDKGQSEKVVPREEQPVDMREARAPAPKMMVPTAGAGVPAPGSAPLATASTAVANPNEPKKVRTFAIRPDGATGLEPVGPRPSAGTRVANVAPTASPPIAARPAPPADTRTRTASIPPAAPASPSVNAPPPPAGGHVVQLSSQRSEAEAQASFRALQAKYPSVLGGKQPLIRRVELGDKGIYYRAQVGPFASAEQANEICSSLKSAGGQCVVQRN